MQAIMGADVVFHLRCHKFYGETALEKEAIKGPQTAKGNHWQNWKKLEQSAAAGPGSQLHGY